MATEVRLIDANAMMDEVYDADEKQGNDVWHTGDIEYLVMALPTVDAVEVEEIREFAKDVVYQFGYYGQYNGRLHIMHGGLSTLEWAFDILGWNNPHPAPECECEIDGCHEHATCGATTNDGYKRMCGRHCLERRTDK